MDENTIHRIAELTSLSLTAPTVISGIAVVLLWGKPAYESMSSKELTPHQWFIIGVTAGFIGSVLDNLFWTIPWLASYLKLEQTSYLMSIGVYFNIFSRQACGILAAFCHLKAAASTSSPTKRFVSNILAGSWIAFATTGTVLAFYFK